MQLITIGIDVGTQGTRMVALTESGERVAHAFAPLPPVSEPKPGWREQNAEDWWAAVSSCLQEGIAQLRTRDPNLPFAVQALAVCSTSGTIVPVDREGKALRPAIMYNDSRAVAEVEEVRQAGAELERRLGYCFNASFALPKLCWLRRREPDVYTQTYKFLHASDFIVGKLTGVWGLSDYSNALKTGYDVTRQEWPAFLSVKLGLDEEKLPEVYTPGTVMAPISRQIANKFGLSPKTAIVAGMTDGCAGQLASGARKAGDWTSTIGTTFILKGITDRLILDPRLYSHRHPDGWWMPGGASNCGGAVLNRRFGRERLAEWDKLVAGTGPSKIVVYPLDQKGERFPFVHPEAEGFIFGEPRNDADLYRGYLEGLALVEKLSLQMIRDLGVCVNPVLYTMGGAAKSRVWLQIRADVLQMEIRMPELEEPAVGMAVLAAKGVSGLMLADSQHRMIRIRTAAEPNPTMCSRYEEAFALFKGECVRRGYIGRE